MRVFLLSLIFGSLSVTGLLAAPEIYYDAAEGNPDPTRQGWHESKVGQPICMAVENAVDGEEKAWKIGDQSTNVNQLIYRHSLADAGLPFQSWRARARLRVEGASAKKLRDAYLEIQDGRSIWAVVFIQTDARGEIGYVTSEGFINPLYEGNLSETPFEIELNYDPDSDSLRLSVNGQPVDKKISREEVPPVGRPGRTFISWGDGTADALPTDARSEVYWQYVSFEPER